MSQPGAAAADGLLDGLDAFQRGDLLAARDNWLPLAEAGDPVAQFNLGKLYEYGGPNLRQDYAQAARWYREAAAQGIPAAQNNLALMYAKGRGLPRDRERSVELWIASAEADYTLAQYNLALAYFRGDGIARDEELAAAWFHEAAEAGLPEAQYAMGQMVRLGRAGPPSSGSALAWYQLAAAQGHSDAERAAAELVRQGVHPVPIEQQRPLIAAALPPVATDGPDMPPPPSSGAAAQLAPATEDLDLDIGTAKGPEEAAPEEAAPELAAPSQAAGEPESKPESEPAPEAAASPPQELVAALPDEDEAATLMRLWLASASSAPEAKALWQGLREAHGEALGSVTAEIRVVDHGKQGRYYRVLAGPMASRQAGLALCRRLRDEAPGAFCKLVAP